MSKHFTYMNSFYPDSSPVVYAVINSVSWGKEAENGQVTCSRSQLESDKK